MEIDFSSVWSWTLPLWGLAVLVAFLGGALTQEAVLKAVAPSTPHTGGGYRKSKSLH
jgi:hypothetical protein